jgi:hypothetical protein
MAWLRATTDRWVGYLAGREEELSIDAWKIKEKTNKKK